MNFQPIVSSNLESAALDAATGDIIVRFKNGTAYKYPKAGVVVWNNFQKTFSGKNGLSAGKFLNAQLRPLAYERIEDWEEK